MDSVHETKLLMIGVAIVAVLGYVIFEYVRRQQKHA
jgi:hypothetical protein